MNIPIDDMNAECERKTTIARETNSRANAMQAIKEDAPVMKAWNNYKSSDEFKNTRKWALHEEHVDGSLWAAFYAGFFACAVDQVNTDDPQQPTSDDVMAALLFCLWHHQGGNSKIGQPIRLALGIGQDEPLTDEQLAIAERVQSALCASASNSAVKVQACRTEDREMLATDAGKELLTKAAAALSAQQQSPVDPVIRDICELDPADPDDANTVSVSVDDLRLILNRHVHPSAPHSASQPDAVAVPRDVVIAAANKLKLIGQIYDGDKESRRLSEQLRVAQEARLNGDCEALNLGRIWLSDSSLKTWFPYTAEELERLSADKAALRHYAIALQKAAEPFCAIKAGDGDTFNGYAPETIIRLEASVQEIRRLRMCAGYGLPSSGTAVDNAQEAK